MSSLTLFLQATFVVISAIVVMIYMNMFPVVIRKLTTLAHGKDGCAPVPDVGNVTLHYFAGRGRGEAIRLILEFGEIPYTETKFTKDTWPTYKRIGTDNGLYTFSQVPAIETTNGVRIAQSYAIIHHLGRSLGLDCDCEDMTYCEVLALGVEDAGMKLGRMLYDPNFSLHDRENYINDVMPLWLGYFEKVAPSLTKMERAFFASNRRTWVDFLIFNLFDTNLDFVRYDMGQEKEQNPNLFDMFPKLTSFYRYFSGQTKIAQYLQSKRRPSYKIPKMPSKSAETQTA